MRLKGLRRLGVEEHVEEGEGIDPHGGGGGPVRQGEDEAWRREEEGKTWRKERSAGSGGGQGCSEGVPGIRAGMCCSRAPGTV